MHSGFWATERRLRCFFLLMDAVPEAEAAIAAVVSEANELGAALDSSVLALVMDALEAKLHAQEAEAEDGSVYRAFLAQMAKAASVMKDLLATPDDEGGAYEEPSLRWQALSFVAKFADTVAEPYALPPSAAAELSERLAELDTLFSFEAFELLVGHLSGEGTVICCGALWFPRCHVPCHVTVL